MLVVLILASDAVEQKCVWRKNMFSLNYFTYVPAGHLSWLPYIINCGGGDTQMCARTKYVHPKKEMPSPIP